MASLPSARALGRCAVRDGHLYVMGGNGPDGGQKADVFVSAGATGRDR